MKGSRGRGVVRWDGRQFSDSLVASPLARSLDQS